MLTEDQFLRVRRLASSLAGIELAERHRELLHRRSRRSGILDEAGLDSLLGAAEAGEAGATRQLVSLLTTKFTTFFRHPRHFEIAAAHAQEVARMQQPVRLWSAGTATGEEAWSLAIALREAFPDGPLPARLLATDIDHEALAVARAGEYGEAALATVSTTRRERFFQALAPPGRRRIDPGLASLVRFEVLNLVEPDWPGEAPFDVIFCRNVLMYLAPAPRRAALGRLVARMAPDGLLMLDPTEHPGAFERELVRVDDGVYQRRAPADAPSCASRGSFAPNFSLIP